MNRYGRAFLGAVLTGWVVVAIAAGPAKKDAPKPDTSAATKPARKTIRFKHLSVDLARRQIVMSAEVCTREGALEFLVCKAGTKEYESVLKTSAPGARLHGALLMLGLTQGKPARWSGQDETARFLPPQGPALKILLRWKDKKGKAHEAAAASWLAPAGDKTVPVPEQWIFVGSDVLPDGRYLADLDGEIISVANFASAVIDVPFESSNKNALLDYVANTKVIPPVGTAVEVVIRPLPNAGKSPHARMLLEIDRFGRLRAAGRPIQAAELGKWAQEYVARHAKGQVHVRADGRALVFDVERATEELRIGGVQDIIVTRLVPQGVVLPRTPQQARQKLKWWAGQFKNAKELLRDPGEEAQAVLEQINRDIQYLKATQAMWGEYSAHLRTALNRYKATTQPAKVSPARADRASGGEAPAN